ncbi:MAG TPA: hypothetical protein ENN30_00815 [Candidatus Woesearchaeota archaeon]|nr:hypothetical protein [Candidatus Woesearchaeota archaeon]
MLEDIIGAEKSQFEKEYECWPDASVLERLNQAYSSVGYNQKRLESWLEPKEVKRHIETEGYTWLSGFYFEIRPGTEAVVLFPYIQGIGPEREIQVYTKGGVSHIEMHNLVEDICNNLEDNYINMFNQEVDERVNIKSSNTGYGLQIPIKKMQVKMPKHIRMPKSSENNQRPA